MEPACGKSRVRKLARRAPAAAVVLQGINKLLAEDADKGAADDGAEELD